LSQLWTRTKLEVSIVSWLCTLIGPISCRHSCQVTAFQVPRASRRAIGDHHTCTVLTAITGIRKNSRLPGFWYIQPSALPRIMTHNSNPSNVHSPIGIRVYLPVSYPLDLMMYEAGSQLARWNYLESFRSIQVKHSRNPVTPRSGLRSMIRRLTGVS
jgi:hypothetical protein